MDDREFLGLTLDRFQAEAFQALDEGQSVVVSAPTGAGKTLIAEYAITRALERGQRAIYTTPIKALSNQKFRELGAIAPGERTGLVTGDNSIRPSAPVVVMTTEVLRNMIYGQPAALDDVAVIVIDEVHFLQDRFRGPVWEEVIVHAPERIQLVCLSATVSNADELGEWIRTLRGPTTTVVRTRRPVRLEQWFAVTPKGEAVEMIPLFTRKKGSEPVPNPQGRRYDAEAPKRRQRSGQSGRPKQKFFTPSRRELIERLEFDNMLPVIWFIFSRRGCDEAVSTMQRAGIQMSTALERPAIAAIIDAHTAHLSTSDLDALGFRAWRGALLDGFASHHAGQIPAFKEATEEAFSQGLLKVVFATETLALGLNMPARTVIIDKLTKFEGTLAGPDARAVHEFLSPAQFTQMTGRAGRRGIDDLGHAIVLWSPWVTFEQATTLAANENFPLRSAFRPTYNMTANLVRRYPQAQAISILRRSFAQFQMDSNLVADAERLRRLNRRADELRAAAQCELGDVEAALRVESSARRDRSAARTGGPDPEVLAALRRLRPGTVIRGGFSEEPCVVVSTSERTQDQVTVKVLAPSGHATKLTAAEIAAPPEILGLIRLPEPYRPNENAWRKKVTAAFGVFLRDARNGTKNRTPASRPPTAVGDRAGEPIRHRGDSPVTRCPDFRRHVAAINRLARVQRDISTIERRIISAESSLEAAFTSVRSLLAERGYLRGWELLEPGVRLSQLHHELDVLVSWALESGWFVDLTPAELAGVASLFCYQGRRVEWWDDTQLPTGTIRGRYEQLMAEHETLNDQERRLRLPLTRAPDPGFVDAAFRWAGGIPLTQLVDEDLTGGDFVRTSKLIIDLLRQIADLAPEPTVRSAASRAETAVTRGVVKASLTVSGATEAASARPGSRSSAGTPGTLGPEPTSEAP